ncbi:unnamed protein product [Cylindrotheca closterium]|uniref:Uncharacterized protein n=1 Tax=Cylindrotheca closterium TaxID=2856 RepID=A0AAD2FLT3_9STRA|nr:unnamed protein product [Cylindrotheca closterium]
MAPFTKTPSFLKRFVSSMRDLLDGHAHLGKKWEGLQATEAFDQGELVSMSGGGKRLRVAFRNLCPFPLLLCWVSHDSQLHHFYKISPQTEPIKEEAMVTIEDHVETTVGGDTFCFVCLPEDDIDEARRNKKLPKSASVVAGFMPNDYKKNKGEKDPVYLVTIGYEDEDFRGSQEEVICCKPTFLRKRQRPTFDVIDKITKPKPAAFFLKQAIAKIDPTPYDTSTKFYERKLLGGWPVYMEPNWHGGDKNIEKRLCKDLEAAAKILPRHAVEYLRENCPIWINSSIKFGPRVCPSRAVGCCYHPTRDWLEENGHCVEKHKCVEINDGLGYAKDVDFWGVGGLMVHELSHAYHHRLLQDGYENKEIEDCFQAAMEEGLYEKVKVHGPQGPEAKAYACSNCMEYFAELSTAFLGGTATEVEYNKWFPFNRQQIKDHDPRAYRMLSKMWKVETP